MTEAALISVRELTEERVDTFAELLQQPPNGWCWCVAWEVPSWDGWGDRDGADNRALRETLWLQGQYDGYLVYQQQTPVGWIRVGPATRWPKLASSRGVELSDDLYVVTCLGMRPELRGQGLMRTALGAVLDDLRGKGVNEVAAVPKTFAGQKVDDDDVWNGPERLYASLGFKPVREGDGFVEVRLAL